MIDTLRLTAEEAVGLLERKEVSGAELHGAYLDAIAERDSELHCYLRTVDERRGRRRADRAQGRDLDEGDRDDRRLEDPRGLRSGVRLDRRGALPGGGPAGDRQDEHRRVRDGLLDRELRLRPVAQPVGSRARAGRLRRRDGGGGVRRARAVGARLRHGRLDQAAVRALRERRPAADLRHRQPLRDRRVRVEPRPGRAGREERARLRAALFDHRRPRSSRLDDGRRAAGRAARGRGPARPPDRRPEGAERGRGDRARRVARPCGGRSSSREELGAEVGECELPRSVEYGLPCYYLSRRPRPPRTSPATTASATACASTPATTTRWSSARATPASATSRSAGSCSARTRSRRATTRRTTARRRRCGR